MLLDLTGLLQLLDRGLEDSADINDPLALGLTMDVAAEMIKTNSHDLNILLQASQTPLRAARSFCTQLMQPSTLPAYCLVKDRLQALMRYITQSDSTDSNAGTLSPLFDFFHTEWDDLCDSVSSLLSQLQQPVQYSSFLLKLSDLSHLEKRAELLSAYLWRHNTSDPPGAYRLSVFKNAKGFLGAVMRQAAQDNHKHISDIALHFQVRLTNNHTKIQIVNFLTFARTAECRWIVILLPQGSER